MPLSRRLPFALPFVALLALTFQALATPSAAAKEKYPIELAVVSETGAQLAGAAVKIEAESGEPFSFEGVTDKRGRVAAKLPDFTRVYEVRVTLDGFLDFKQSVDLSTQNLQPGATATLTVTLPAKGGPSAEETYNDGVRAIQADDRATAEAKMKAAVELAPDLAPAWSVLAMLYADGKRWPEALDAADKTLALKSGDVSALRTRAEALDALGRKDEAAAALDALAAAEPTKETARLLFNAGAAAWQTKDAELATKRFEQALVLDPQLHQACSALAEVKIGSQDLAGALAELERGLAIAPTEKKIWRRKIAVLKTLGRNEEAEAAEKKLAELGE